MLKTRSWIKLGLGLILLLFLLFIAVLAWPKAPPTPAEIAKRGRQAPAERVSAWNGSFGAARDWFDQNWDALARWDKNPLGIHKQYLGQHLRELKDSKDPKDQAEYRRLLELAKKWHENLLSRYPELRVTYRDVPDEQNALMLLDEIQQRLKDKGSDLTRAAGIQWPEESWDSKAVQALLDANRSTIDELRSICLMPESSGKGLSQDADDWTFLMNGRRLLILDARIAAEGGDLTTSMRSIEAAIALGNHMTGAESSTLFQSLFGGQILVDTRRTVFESILPNLPPAQIDLAAWENLLKPTIQTPADFAQTMRGQWNGMMMNSILPALADPGERQIPTDADLFIEANTAYYSKVVQTHNPLSLTDLPSHPGPAFDPTGLSWRDRDMAGLMTFNSRLGWEEQQIHTGLTQAAFAILKGQPVPNDPIHGQPYIWNPETRELSLPKGPEFSRMQNRPIKLPKL